MMKIGFIGLGIMGSRMALNLQKAGYQLTVFNRTKEKAAQLLEGGAHWAESPAQVAQESNTVISMLANPEVVKSLALSEGSLLDHLSEGDTWIESSTLNPSFVKIVAKQSEKRGVNYIDAPVAGTKGPAEKGELLFLLGGEKTAIEKHQPLFDIMGKKKYTPWGSRKRSIDENVD